MSVTGPKGMEYSSLPGLNAGQPRSRGEGGDFLSALKLQLVDLESRNFGTLLSASSPGDSGPAGAAWALLDGGQLPKGLSPTGRNTALFDPESAYRMMTVINAKEASYKAELSEMDDMKSQVSGLGEEASKLGTIDAATGNAEIRERLLAFADAYNGWIRRFDDELRAGGLLAGTQAATVSQWELEQSVENPFNGAKDGLRGLEDLGFTIDPATNLASLDPARLDAALASNKAGVAGTLRDFSANFARSAELLNSAGNFIPNRIDNLARAIGYIDGHKESLQAEFGLGDAARPTGQVARALARYNSVHGLAA